MPIAPAPKERTSLGLTRARSKTVVGRLINTGRIEVTNEGGDDATALLVYCFAAAVCVKNCRDGGGRRRRRGSGRPGAERAGARLRLQADGGNEEEDSGNDRSSFYEGGRTEARTGRRTMPLRLRAVKRQTFIHFLVHT